jgi:hypothetical protein
MGSFLLALVWVTYNMYLGPRDLPFEAPIYSGYEDLWLRSFPGAFVSALLGWGLSGTLSGAVGWRLRHLRQSSPWRFHSALLLSTMWLRKLYRWGRERAA